MPTFEVDKADRARAQRLVDFVDRELTAMSVEARFVFVIEMNRRLKPEIEELKRRGKESP